MWCHFHKKCLLPKKAYTNKLTMDNLGSEIIGLFPLCFSGLFELLSQISVIWNYSALSIYLFYNYNHYLKDSLLFKRFPFHCHSLSLSITYTLLPYTSPPHGLPAPSPSPSSLLPLWLLSPLGKPLPLLQFLIPGGSLSLGCPFPWLFSVGSLLPQDLLVDLPFENQERSLFSSSCTGTSTGRPYFVHLSESSSQAWPGLSFCICIVPGTCRYSPFVGRYTQINSIRQSHK